MKKQMDWVKLVVDAKKGNEGLERLYGALGYMFRYLRARCSTMYQEDAIQEARIDVWKALPKVDLSRPIEIKTFLTSIMLWAMFKHIKDSKRQKGFNSGRGYHKSFDFSYPASLENDLYGAIPANNSTEYLFDYDDLLGYCLKYIKENGRFSGVWLHSEKVFGKSKERLSQMFRDSCKEFVVKYGLAGNKN